MKLKEFLLKYDIDYSVDRIDSEEVKKYEELLKTKFGVQLKEYIINYGYIGYKHIELYGINATQGEGSDMIKTTVTLRKRDPQLNDLIAIENQGDGEYYFVDSKDQVYRYFQGAKELSRNHVDMESYIVHRLMDI